MAAMVPQKSQEIVRVLRLVQYIGPRDQVEEQIKNSIHGTKRFSSGKRGSGWGPVDVEITAVTIGTFPEILNQAEGGMRGLWGAADRRGGKIGNA